ncbi:AAA-ATPase, partial [Cucurbita argyrosperma subsp. argyrosperma]
MSFLRNMPSTTSVFSAYTSFAASTMVARTMMSESHTIISQIIPQKLRDQIASKFNALFGSISSQMVLVIEENIGIAINELYRASETYLSTKIPPSMKHLKASKAPGDNNFTFKINKGDVLIDVFEGTEIAWELISTEKQSTNFDFDTYTQTSETIEKRHYQISFHKNQRGGKEGIFYMGHRELGKSSLVAAMAEYLTSVQTNSALRTMLFSTTHSSIIVIEDIDCSAELQDRKNGGSDGGNTQNVHITYLTPSSFHTLASNYLHITHNHRFKHIQDLISEVEVTPAEIAEQLMTSDDDDVALESVLEFVNVKKRKKMGKECGSEVIEKTGQIPQQEPSGKQRCKRRRKRQGR